MSKEKDHDPKLGKIVPFPGGGSKTPEEPREDLPEDFIDDLLEEEHQAEVNAFERAQEVCWDAFESEESPRVKVQMALEALSLHPKCADAWFLLGTYSSKDPLGKLGMFRNGVHAAWEYYGEDFEESMIPWLDVRTRPYMRCRFAFATMQWKAGLSDEAVEEAVEILSLNPRDNQGVRYPLMGWLLSLERFDHALHLYHEYAGDGSVEWVMAALILRLNGRLPEDPWSEFAKEAKQKNKHLLSFLAHKKRLPKESPETYVAGEETEVVVGLIHIKPFAQAHRKVWREIQQRASQMLKN